MDGKHFMDPMFKAVESEMFEATNILDDTLKQLRKESNWKSYLASAQHVPKPLLGRGRSKEELFERLSTASLLEDEADPPDSLGCLPHDNQELHAEGLVVFNFALRNYGFGLEVPASYESRLSDDVIRWSTDLFRYTKDDKKSSPSGFFSNSQPSSRIELIRLSLGMKFADYSRLGFEAVHHQQPVVYVGLPVDSFVQIPYKPLTLNASSLISDLNWLKNAMKDDVESGQRVPVLCILVAGSPTFCSVDDIEYARAVCKEYAVWLHVEGSRLPLLAMSSVPDSVCDVKLGDSITLDLRLLLGSSITPFLTLVKCGSRLPSEAAGRPAKPDLVLSLPCLRPDDPFSFAQLMVLWYLLQRIGHKSILERVQSVIFLAERFAERLSAEHGHVQLLTTKQQRELDKKSPGKGVSAQKDKEKSWFRVTVEEQNSVGMKTVRKFTVDELFSSLIKNFIFWDVDNPIVLFRFHLPLPAGDPESMADKFAALAAEGQAASFSSVTSSNEYAHYSQKTVETTSNAEGGNASSPSTKSWTAINGDSEIATSASQQSLSPDTTNNGGPTASAGSTNENTPINATDLLLNSYNQWLFQQLTEDLKSLLPSLLGVGDELGETDIEFPFSQVVHPAGGQLFLRIDCYQLASLASRSLVNKLNTLAVSEAEAEAAAAKAAKEAVAKVQSITGVGPKTSLTNEESTATSVLTLSEEKILEQRNKHLNNIVDAFMVLFQRRIEMASCTFVCAPLFRNLVEKTPGLVAVATDTDVKVELDRPGSDQVICEDTGVFGGRAALGFVRCVPQVWAEAPELALKTAARPLVDSLNRLVGARLQQLAGECGASVAPVNVVLLSNSELVPESDHCDGNNVIVGLRCGLITDRSQVDATVSLIAKTAVEVEQTNREFTKAMADFIQQGIDAATRDLAKEEEARLLQEGVLRQVPLVGSFVNWLSPLPSDPSSQPEGHRGRSFNLTSGQIESTESIYRYKMQVVGRSDEPTETTAAKRMNDEESPLLENKRDDS